MTDKDVYQQLGEDPGPPLPADWKVEITAMGNAYNALKSLDRTAQLRAMRWLDDRLQADSMKAARDDEEPF